MNKYIFDPNRRVDHSQLFLLLFHLEMGDFAGESTGVAQWKYQCAYLSHGLLTFLVVPETAGIEFLDQLEESKQ